MNTIFDLSYLSYARRRAKISLDEAAAAIGCTASTLCNWEQGHTDIPASKLIPLMNLYGEPINNLFVSIKGDKKNE